MMWSNSRIAVINTFPDYTNVIPFIYLTCLSGVLNAAYEQRCMCPAQQFRFDLQFTINVIILLLEDEICQLFNIFQFTLNF